ncbi:TPA: 50S ribosomal protein L18 [Candidatus Bathyarchaeota archaeon]|nr:50S ribosomal protein L18 [Candidatus Bathyarchaeota archaeon]
MARGPRYRVKFRRRREGKTNYRKRKGMILSRFPRLVVRVTNKHTIVQLVKARVEGDRTLVSAHSNSLRLFGWRGCCANTPAVYLTTLLACLKAKRKGIREAILDIGLSSPTPGAKVFASLKAATDAGINVPHNGKILPPDDRISGEHIARYAQLIASDAEVYRRRFSRHLEHGLRPEDLPRHFMEVRERILEDVGGASA